MPETPSLPAAARRLIAALRLAPHPEGGFYRETYRCPERASRAGLPRRFPGPRPFSTAILYLLPAGAFSRLHRIRSDEAWHFHLGGPLEVVSLSPTGRVTRAVLGPEPDRGHLLQHVVPAGHWFGARPLAGTRFSLVGCTVSPGFDFADLEMGSRPVLLRRFPKARALVRQLTPP